MLIVIILSIIILIALATEKIMLDKLIAKIPVRILVNGTRGKTSTVRLVACAMNQANIKTMAKTTGSEASLIYPDGRGVPINRKRGRNMVREQRLLFAEAVKNGCTAVVCECMALRPESQIVFSEKLFKPTAVAITNTYADHVDIMGDKTEEVINLSIPKGMKAIVCNEEYEGSLEAFKTKFNRKSIALALKITDFLGIDTSTALSGMQKAEGDIGLTGPICIGKRTVINAFAVNDIQSARQLLQGLDCDKITVVYANRSDREFRLQMFGKLFEELGVSDLVVIGDNLFKCKKYFGCRAYKNSEFGKLIDSGKDTIVCLGNIVGSGKSFLDYCRGESK